jgi:hypothetical protein
VPEFGQDRFRRLGSEDAQRIAERQAGFDAADDDVDRVGGTGREISSPAAS